MCQNTAICDTPLIIHIRHFLTIDSCKQLIQSMVTSQIDYANSLLYGLPAATLRPLQLLQNRAAKLVLGLKATDSATDALKSLHWLPIKYRIDFKVACIVHKCLHGIAPSYLSDMVEPHIFHYATRHANQDGAITLKIPSFRKKCFASRSFHESGPRVWNALPSNFRLIDNFNTFKRILKSHYFDLAFN